MTLLTSACATLMGPPEDTPPEAPSARVFRTMSPTLRDQMWPQIFDGRSFVDRLVCASNESPTWKRLQKRGLFETYELNCPGEPRRTLELDVGEQAPPPPETMRQLDAKAFVKYRDSLYAIERKDYVSAMSLLREAEALAPGEPIFKREQIYCLYAQGKMAEAFLAADELAERSGSPLVFKYRALTAREIGLRSEVVPSLEGIVRTSRAGHPLYAEAVCAKGMILLTQGDPEANELVKEGCALEYAACCETLAAQRKEKEAEMEEALMLPEESDDPVPMSKPAEPPPAPVQSKPEATP